MLHLLTLALLIADPASTAAAASPPPVASAVDASALLAKHHAFVGWSADDGALKGLRVDEDWSRAGVAPKPYLREVRRGMLYRDDYRSTSQAESETFGFSGRMFWTSDENGMVSPIVSAEQQTRLATDLIFSEGTTELPGTLKQTDTVRGTPVDVVRVSLEGADPVHLYIDPTTGAYLRAVVGSGDDATTYDINSYLSVGKNRRIIGSYTVNGTTYTFKNPEVGAFDDSALLPPTPSATWTFANDKPFHFDADDDAFYIEARVNGVPGYFELDTGDSDTTLTDNFANKLHLKTIEQSKVVGLDGVGTALIRKVDTIEVGGNTFSNVYVTTLDMQWHSQRNRPIDGLLGYDFLAGAIVSLDPSTNMMRIQDPGTVKLTPPAGGGIMTVDLSNATPTVPIDVDGNSLYATMDTGNGFPITISKAYAERKGFVLGTVVTIDAASVSGENGDFCGNANAVHIGGFNYLTPVVCENTSMRGDGAYVGYDFLCNFKYIFDYPEAKIYMTPDPWNSR